MAHPLQSRLGKLTPALGAKERFLLVLHAHNAGETADPSLRGTMPPAQVRGFNRYAQLLVVANLALWPIQEVLATHVAAMEHERARLQRVEAAAARLQQRASPEKAPAGIRDQDHPVGVVEQVAAELRAELRQELSLRWRELRALETVWAEVAAEFDGEPAMERQVRERAAETKQRLQDLTDALLPEGNARRLPAPKPEFVDGLRTLVRQCYSYMGWIAPEDAPADAARAPERGRAHGRQSR